MKHRIPTAAALLILAASGASAAPKAWTEDYDLDACTFATTGANAWFPLQPGAVLILEGEDKHEGLVEVHITVTEDTETVAGIETRVVLEEEWIDGEIVEISHNWFAHCVETGAVYYFGEEVDIYEDGEVVSHDGEWRHGEDGARAGLIMPGTFLLGSLYYQEIAEEAQDRAEHVAMGLTVETEAGVFEDCVAIEETTPLEPGSRSDKVYCPGVGLVVDDVVELVEAIPAP